MTTRNRRPASREAPAGERIARLPGWAQDHIRSLRSQLSYAETRLDEIEAQLTVVRGGENEKQTNARLDLDDIAVALPDGAMVTYHDEFSVQPAEGETGIAVTLIPFGELVITVTGEDRIEIRKRAKP